MSIIWKKGNFSVGTLSNDYHGLAYIAQNKDELICWGYNLNELGKCLKKENPEFLHALIQDGKIDESEI